MKTVLILVDGMRSDAISRQPKANALLPKASYCLNTQTVFPPVTLPCHMSLFHSVAPDRHGTTTNIYMPQVRPVPGLCEQLRLAKKKCAFFYNWEELRDLSRPGSLAYSQFISGSIHGYEKANHLVTDSAIDYITKHTPDFAFLYLGYVDHAGHNHGWMSDEYHQAIASSFDDIYRLLKALPEDYTVLITADHGGHGRGHGENIPEDMTIPLLCLGNRFTPNTQLSDISILDIAPTIATLLQAEIPQEWEGKSII